LRGAIRGTDVDVDECLACPKLRRFVVSEPPYVVCTAWRDVVRSPEPVL